MIKKLSNMVKFLKLSKLKFRWHQKKEKNQKKKIKECMKFYTKIQKRKENKLN